MGGDLRQITGKVEKKILTSETQRHGETQSITVAIVSVPYASVVPHEKRIGLYFVSLLYAWNFCSTHYFLVNTAAV
jgi:hypothetical protein